MQPSRLRFAATIIASSVLGGCGSLGGALISPRNSPDLSAERPTADSSPVTPLLEMMNALPQGDPARQAKLIDPVLSLRTGRRELLQIATVQYAATIGSSMLLAPAAPW